MLYLKAQGYAKYEGTGEGVRGKAVAIDSCYYIVAFSRYFRIQI